MDENSSGSSNQENSKVYTERLTQVTSSASNPLNNGPLSLANSHLLFFSTENEVYHSAPPSLKSLGAHIGKAVSSIIGTQEDALSTTSRLKSSFTSDICGSMGGDGDISKCRVGDSSQISGSTVDECGSGTFPRPYTDLIHIAFPDKLLAKALAEIVRKRPDNPIRYLVFYLKNNEENIKRNNECAADLQAMIEYKKSLEIPEVESVQEIDGLDVQEEGSNFTAEEMNYEVENESLPVQSRHENLKTSAE